MHVESFYTNVISGRAGRWAAPMRWGLSAAAVGYGQVVNLRNRFYDSGVSEIVSLPVPVVSVGNITTGGTGKTPVVLALIGRLRRWGHKPAVVARGYKSRSGESGDELTVIAQRVPEAVCIASPNRVAGGLDAVRRGCDVIVLDDGFQHRRLARDLDVVMVDATDPFGSGDMLPRGRLREPVACLRRADLIVISRADQVTTSKPAELASQLAELAPGVPVVKCRHKPTGLVNLSGRPCREVYRRAVVFAAIGNPQSFARTVEQMNIEVVEQLRWPDHHSYTARDVAKLVAVANGVNHDVVLTTHKDAVKLRGLDVGDLEPLRVVEIDIEFLDGADTVVDAQLRAALTSGSDPSPRIVSCERCF